jgi:hypothetical protein
MLALAPDDRATYATVRPCAAQSLGLLTSTSNRSGPRSRSRSGNQPTQAG